MWFWSATGCLLLISLVHGQTTPADRSKCPPMPVTTGVSNTKAVFNNIDFLGKGYDVLTGNPHSSGIDPGFRQRVFDLMSKFCGRLTADLRYVIPEYVDVVNVLSCSLDFGSKYSNSSRSYLEDLKKGITMEAEGSYGKVAKAAFQGSLDFKSINKEMEKSNGLVIETSAKCSVYSASLTAYDTPNVDYNFRLAVEQLPETFSTDSYNEAFINFFRSFGTHVVASMVMGASYGERFTIHESDSSKFEERSIDAKLATEVSGTSGLVSVAAKMGISTSELEKRISAFNSKVSSRATISIGSKPPGVSNLTTDDKKAELWVGQVFDSPVPIQITMLQSIVNVLLPKYFPDFDATVLAKKRAALTMALENYCEVYARAAGIVDSCEPPAYPTPIPVTTPMPVDTFIRTGRTQICLFGAGSKNKGLSTPGSKDESQYQAPPVPHIFVHLELRRGLQITTGDYVFISSNGRWLWENHSWLYYRDNRQSTNSKLHWQVIKCDNGKGQIKFDDCIYLKNGNNRRFLQPPAGKGLRVELTDNPSKWIIRAC